MKFEFRSRLFLYLLLMLFLFVLGQVVIFLLVEVVNWRTNPYEPLSEGLMEVAMTTGLTLLLVPPILGAAWLISRWMIRPLLAMAETAGRIRKGAWSDRIETAAMPDDETARRIENAQAARQATAATQYDRQADGYRRALTACLEARGYAVR